MFSIAITDIISRRRVSRQLHKLHCAELQMLLQSADASVNGHEKAASTASETKDS